MIPEVDQQVKLQRGHKVVEGLCVEVLDDRAISGGILIKVMVRELFNEGDQCWIVDENGSRFGTTVRQVEHHSMDCEITLSATVSPGDGEQD